MIKKSEQKKHFLIRNVSTAYFFIYSKIEPKYFDKIYLFIFLRIWMSFTNRNNLYFLFVSITFFWFFFWKIIIVTIYRSVQPFTTIFEITLKSTLCQQLCQLCQQSKFSCRLWNPIFLDNWYFRNLNHCLDNGVVEIYTVLVIWVREYYFVYNSLDYIVLYSIR